MPVVCDYSMIQGDAVVTIGDSRLVWEKDFNTGGRRTSNAFIIFNVRGLTHATANVTVSINGTAVGSIHPYFPGGSDVDVDDIGAIEKARQQNHWYTQMIAFPGSVLNDGDNTIRIEAVRFPGNTGANAFDDFDLKDVICFFKQSA